MVDLNRWPMVQRIGHRFRSNMYIPVYHTNRQPLKNIIGVVKNHLVGMALNKGEGNGRRWRYISMFLNTSKSNC